MDSNLRLDYCGFEDYYVTHCLDNNYGALVTRSLYDSEANNSYPWEFTSIRFRNSYEGYKIVHEELITFNDAEVRKLLNLVKGLPIFTTDPH